MRIRYTVLALSLFLCTNLLTGIICYAQENLSEHKLNGNHSVKHIVFSGYEWEVKTGYYYPGKNDWSEDNVWVDQEGFLHLKITRIGAQWYCAELSSVKSFGYGTYQFKVVGPVDKLDPNIVLGLFVYPSAENPDEGNELDIEYAKWGKPDAPIGNYTVTPSAATYQFSCILGGNYTTHQLVWTEKQALFQSFYGHVIKDDMAFANWLYNAKEYKGKNAVPPVRVHMNLWLFKGEAPLNREEQEVIIKEFIFSEKTSQFLE